MIKILIVDDEPLVRIGMNSLIAWKEHGYVIVAEASNGVQGLEKIEQYSPDLVLVDIMMPQMDGIEMIEIAKKNGFQGKFIILSCVTDLAFLQQAMRLGVSRYVLKSTINPKEILGTIEEVAAELKKGFSSVFEYANEPATLERKIVIHEFLNLMIKGVIVSPEIISEKMKIFGFDNVTRTFLQVYTAMNNQASNDLLYKVSAICERLFDGIRMGTCFVSYDDHLVVIIQTENSRQAEEFSFRLQASSKQYFDAKLNVSSSEVDIKNWNLYDSYANNKNKISKIFFSSANHTNKHSLIPSTEFSNFDKLSSTLEIIKSMMVQSSAISENEAKKVFAGAIEYVMLMYDLKMNAVLPQIEIKNILSIFSSCQTFEEVNILTLQILKKCYQLAEKTGYCEYNDELTDTMVKYIHNNCNSKISTKNVANHVHFSIDYTCKYFKKKTKTNITDYILKLKIFKSRQDLLDGMTVSAVAERYGFSSDGHFVKTFKRYEGITPGLFVKNRLQNQS